MNYATSPNHNSHSSLNEFEIPFDIVPEEDAKEVILFHALAVEENGRETWIQNEFVFESAEDIEYRRTLKQLRILTEEGTVRNIQTIQRTSVQEWLL